MTDGAGSKSRPLLYQMDIFKVADIIHRIAGGFEDNVMQCLSSQSEAVLDLIREQIYNGFDGAGEYLEPTYYEDPFFERRGFWYHRSKDYVAWKYKLTPPKVSPILNLPPRPAAVPNLYIDGTFFGQIGATPKDGFLEITPGSGNGPKIVGKYGERLLTLGTDAVEWFNLEYLLPATERFYKECGYL